LFEVTKALGGKGERLSPQKENKTRAKPNGRLVCTYLKQEKKRKGKVRARGSRVQSEKKKKKQSSTSEQRGGKQGKKGRTSKHSFFFLALRGVERGVVFPLNQEKEKGEGKS